VRLERPQQQTMLRTHSSARGARARASLEERSPRPCLWWIPAPSLLIEARPHPEFTQFQFRLFGP
jgi:hypothetical protein